MIEIIKMTTEELISVIDGLIKDYLPKDKKLEDFTGGYVQQSIHSTKFIAFFGTKQNSNNRSSVQIPIEDGDMDIMYMMLKAKIHSIRSTKIPINKVSLTSRILENKIS